MTLQQITSNIGKMLADNSPAILTAIGVTGLVSTAILAGKGAFQASEFLAHEKQARLDIVPDDDWGTVTVKDKFIMTWKYYIPAAAVGTVAATCILGSNSINNRRTTALVGLYSITDTAFQEYKEKVKETIGEHKEKKVRTDIAEDHMKAHPVESKQIFITGRGEQLCYDKLTGRYFESDMETLRKAQNDINAQCINEMYASQNDFYRTIGLPEVGIGDEIGWSTDTMLDLKFDTAMSTEKIPRPCITIDYRMQPMHNYSRIGG